MATKFQLALQSAVVEKDVEQAYKTELLRVCKGASITSPYNTDGVLTASDMMVIAEFKSGMALREPSKQVVPLMQALAYIRKIKDAATTPDQVPTSIFIGDENECFVVATRRFEEFIDQIPLNTRPNSAATDCAAISRQVMASEHFLNILVHDVLDDMFSMEVIADQFRSFHKNEHLKIEVTAKTFPSVFRKFQDDVLAKRGSTRDAASIFCSLLAGDVMQRASGKSVTLSAGNITVEAKRDPLNAFLNWYNLRFTVKEREVLLSAKDRLLDDKERMLSGDFYTPAEWVNKAHAYIENAFGVDWRDKYVVWDCAAGTGNLTRDFHFEELYLSTLFDADVTTLEQSNTNGDAWKFQFDFLNDDFSKLPTPLKQLIDGTRTDKELLIFINPPFKTQSSGQGKDHTEGLIQTATWQRMNGYNKSRQNLFAQFMYRILHDTQAHMCLFSKPVFMQSESYQKVRDDLQEKTVQRGGFIFPGSEFSGTSSAWGCSFTLWERNGKGENQPHLDVYMHKEVQRRKFTSTDNPASSWVRPDRGLWDKSAPRHDVLPLKNAVSVVTKEPYTNQFPASCIGHMNNNSNYTGKNAQGVGIYSTAYGADTGTLFIFPENLYRCTTLFAARKLITSDWLNDKDEYSAPNTEHPEWQQFRSDSLVHALFQGNALQSAMRNVEYKENKYQVTNEFFFMSNAEMQDEADQVGFTNMYNDTRRFRGERYVYKELQTLTLSPDAQAVLDKARDITLKTVKVRNDNFGLLEDLHPQAWDAGWYQIVRFAKSGLYNDELKVFETLFKQFESRLRPLVYELGFLEK